MESLDGNVEDGKHGEGRQERDLNYLYLEVIRKFCAPVIPSVAAAASPELTEGEVEESVFVHKGFFKPIPQLRLDTLCAMAISFGSAAFGMTGVFQQASSAAHGGVMW
jgi:hypothetical protein